MKIAVEGCMHGDLDKVYDTVKYIENTCNIKIDLLLCYGDFQEVAPVPTIFIGGNHEASNYLWESYYGGWAAPTIYFLGYAVVVKFGNIRISGLSGIYNARNYCLGWIQQGTLGSKPAAQLLEKLRPSYWFSAHLHYKFTALVEHEEGGRVTKFLALDKCLPWRKFLQVSRFIVMQSNLEYT
ncbi:hypothetical protein GOBAR_AA35571 [Gossypium barbadense]|uniref:Uncharacterized protein n=1 Tax=Gossypium barbadense TaxID=3634 RepID=A0A2P5W207_GOSBA|nr:hypothetical protein GOBAR_AA35571 [Gossypium barbadense]